MEPLVLWGNGSLRTALQSTNFWKVLWTTRMQHQVSPLKFFGSNFLYLGGKKDEVATSISLTANWRIFWMQLVEIKATRGWQTLAIFWLWLLPFHLSKPHNSALLLFVLIQIIHVAQSLCSLQDGRPDVQSTFLIRHILKAVRALLSRMPI